MEKESIIGNALEGESYVGKTTTIESMEKIEEMNDRGIIIVPEYSIIGELPSFPRETTGDIKKAIQKIIDLEKKRTDKLVRDLACDKSDRVIFDRGPISCIAFEHAAEKAGYKGASLWMAEAFQKAFEDKSIIVPEGMIYLKAPRKIIEKRKKVSIEKGHGKIMDFLKDKKVIKALNEAFEAFGNFLPDQLFLVLETGGKEPDAVGAEILQFIKDQSPDVSENVPDFVKYARSLIEERK